MSAASDIEWTDATWNPTRGCRKVSPGCKHCYAETFAERWRGVAGHPYERGFDPRLAPEQLALPLSWRRGRRVFVDSMSDLFMAEVPDGYVDRVFGVMAACRFLGPAAAPGHTFQVLTKRADRMRAYLGVDRREAWARHAATLGGAHGADAMHDAVASGRGPLPNVHVGVSVEDRKYGLPRIEHLREVPAALRFLSIEPLLEDLGTLDLRGIGWVIVGGESGPGARECDVAAVRSIVRQCRGADVPVFVKQLGRRPLLDGKRLLILNEAQRPDRKGKTLAAWPDDLQVREFPRAVAA